MANFVDVLGGLSDDSGYKAPCRLATTGDLGTALTGLLVIDGVQTVAGDRVLLWRQADASTNGVWVAQSGAWVRAIDFSSSSSILDGTQVYVTSGNNYSKNIFVCQTDRPVVGTDDIAFALASTSPQAAPTRIPVRKILIGTSDPATVNDGLIVWLVPTGGAKAQSIPSASTVPGGQMLRVKDGFGDSNVNPITITPISGTIEGQPNLVINIRGSEIELTSDGVSNWIVG